MSVSATPASTPPARAQRARAQRLRRVRGVVAGSVAAFGALVAHLAAGGAVEVVPGLVVTGVAVPLAMALTRADGVAPVRLLTLAGAAQMVGHLCLLMAPAGSGHTHHAGAEVGAGAAMVPSASMLAGHAAVAVVVAALAAGLDRAVLDLLADLLIRLLPRTPGAVALPASTRAVAHGRPRVRRTRGATATRSARGPPGRPPAPTRMPLCGVRMSLAPC